MTGVQAVPLKHLALINERSLPDGTDPDKAIRYIDIGAVGRGKLINKPESLYFRDAPSRARRVVREGDTIVSTVRTYLRAVWPVTGDVENLIVSTGFAVITPRQVDPRYLSWWVTADTFVEEVVARSVGVSYPAINASELGQLPVRLPALAEQRAIADYLDAETARIDTLISKKRRLIDLLTERRTTAAEDALAVLRESETSIPLKYLVHESNIRCGTAQESGLLSVSIHHGVVPKSLESSNQTASEDLTTYKLCHPGDIVVNRMRAFQGGLGVSSQRGIVSPDYTVLRVGSRASPRYLHFLMRSSWFVSEMTRRLRGIGATDQGQVRTPRINFADMGLIEVPVPSRDKQDELATDLTRQEAQLTQLVDLQQTQVALLAESRQALITSAVTGESRVR